MTCRRSVRSAWLANTTGNLLFGSKTRTLLRRFFLLNFFDRLNGTGVGSLGSLAYVYHIKVSELAKLDAADIASLPASSILIRWRGATRSDDRPSNAGYLASCLLRAIGVLLLFRIRFV